MNSKTALREAVEPGRAEAYEPYSPLSPAEQWRNVWIFVGCTALQYLAAPALYIGLTQASLLNRLGSSRTVANLPETIGFALSITPVLLAWRFPGISHLKRTLVACYVVAAAAMGLVALTLATPTAPMLRVAAVLLQGAASGMAMPTVIALLWETLGRGLTESRRGFALGLAFGGGPLLAVVGSLGSQLVLTGRLGSLEMPLLEFPWNFAVLFAAGIPAVLLAAVLVGQLVVIEGDEDADMPVQPAPWSGMGEFLAQPILRRATIVTILLYVGNTITANMSLYSKFALDADPESYVGYQNAIRFGIKVAAGVLLGWMVARTNPRAGLVVTGLLFMLGQLWAIFVSGPWYLLAFGIFGAGELVGVYAPNYIIAASAPRNMRRNLAYVTMMMVPAAPAGALFGAIADQARLAGEPALGFRLSFLLCAAILSAGVLLALTTLPARPESMER